jgi:hypothetical protein
MKAAILFLLGLALGVLSAWWRPHPPQPVTMQYIQGMFFVVDNGRVYVLGVPDGKEWRQIYPKPLPPELLDPAELLDAPPWGLDDPIVR